MTETAPATLSPLDRACLLVNGTTRLAELLTERLGRHVSKASVSRWKSERVPAEVCPDIEALTGVRCEELRPDVNWGVLRQQGGSVPDEGFDETQPLDPSCK
jgi:DNA-binding transcriptional regulator YdaS (Cro superfamily)